jgi:hypothetical protein
MPRTPDRAYKDQLGAVLRRQDAEALHLFLRQRAAEFGDERQVEELERRSHDEMVELLHRMTLARPDLAEIHPVSRAWLAANRAGAPRAPARRPLPRRRTR